MDLNSTERFGRANLTLCGVCVALHQKGRTHVPVCATLGATLLPATGGEEFVQGD